MNDCNTTDPMGTVVLPVTAELDLHTFPPKETAEIISAYLEACRERRILEARIVHGKGTGAAARTVHATLDKLPFVLRYSFATPAFGGHGATFVHLAPLEPIPAVAPSISNPKPHCSKAESHYSAEVIRNVIFDWSGTLVDDLPAVWAASNHCFIKAGVEPLSLERFRAEFQLPIKGFYQRYAGHVAPAQLEHWFNEKFSVIHNDVTPQPHALDLLQFCREQRLRTFVLSALPEQHYTVQGAATGFAALVEKVYLGVRDKRERIHVVLAENGLNPDETIFVGDMQHDVDAAHAGGIRSVVVLTGYNNLAQLRESEPDLIVEHLGELQRRLQANELRLEASPGAGPMPHRYPIATVGALVFDEAGSVLLIRTNKWSDLWGIPGGKIEWAETSEDALHREILEETGLAIEKIRFVMVQDAIRPPEFYKEAHFLLLNYTAVALPGQTVRLNSEGQAYQWVPLAQAGQLSLNTPTRILLEAVRQQAKS